MKKILVIEDEEYIRSNILTLLELEGFEPLEAENGLVGVKVAREQRPDLIICDVMMPELDGYSVLADLRQDLATATIPFIFLTAKAEKAELRRGMVLGADDYITKPFTKNELLEAINSRLEKQARLVQHQANEFRQLEEKLEQLTHYDNLTGLPTQRMLEKYFRLTLDQNNSVEKKRAILFLDLTQFALVNNSLGYASGDLLLKEVGVRLASCLDTEDLIARLQADQFAILTVSEGQSETARIQAILTAFAQPFTLKEKEVYITPCIGISRYPSDGDNLEILIQKASIAMLQAKKQGGNSYQFYTPDLTLANSTDRLTLEPSLRQALERDEFELYYQPQVSLQTGEIIGLEALIRWNHPDWGLVSPVRFIPIAEETGLIIPIGEWVLRTACAKAKAWQEAGFPSLRMAVNLSARQFTQSDLSQKVVSILAETGLAPQYLELELTESLVIQDATATIATLNKLKALGISIAIDDFGTGYSSLSYLKHFPFDVLKIDRSFIQNITSDSDYAAITTAIIEMAHSLNLKVMAEGVETEAEKLFLSQHHCGGMQGYLFSRPLKADDLEKLLIEHCKAFAANIASLCEF
ncbi:MAG: EAL domain-containing protein [Chloroflexota bacterium]